MPSVKVDIKPAVLDWVMSQTSEDLIGYELWNRLVEWKAGTKKSTFSQIEKLSKKCNIPLGYFFMDNPPIEQISLVEYRTVDSVELVNPSRELIDTIYEMEEIQSWMRDYRIESGYNSLNFVGSLKTYSDINIIAEHIRQDLGLPKEWFKAVRRREDAFRYVRNLLKDCGVLVLLNGIVGNNTHRKLNIEEFRAFALVDDWAPLIFINSSDSENAKLFSLFHELTHVWMGVNDLYNDRRHTIGRSNIEIICNAVASELILPQDAFMKIWSTNKIKDIAKKVEDIAQIFKCSECVVARKALDHGKISIDKYNKIVDETIKLFEETKKARTGGGDFYRTAANRLDGNLVLAICDSLLTGRTTYTEAFRLTNTSSKTFSEVASSFGGVA